MSAGPYFGRRAPKLPRRLGPPRLPQTRAASDYDRPCPMCRRPITVGQFVAKVRVAPLAGWWHVSCLEGQVGPIASPRRGKRSPAGSSSTSAVDPTTCVGCVAPIAAGDAMTRDATGAPLHVECARRGVRPFVASPPDPDRRRASPVPRLTSAAPCPGCGGAHLPAHGRPVRVAGVSWHKDCHDRSRGRR